MGGKLQGIEERDMGKDTTVQKRERFLKIHSH